MCIGSISKTKRDEDLDEDFTMLSDNKRSGDVQKYR